jgi:hypothetical protein
MCGKLLRDCAGCTVSFVILRRGAYRERSTVLDFEEKQVYNLLLIWRVLIPANGWIK